jgi:hypothetical protein
MITITKAALIAWGLAASDVASNHVRHLKEDVVEGMADASLANPITDSDEGVRLMMAYEVSIAWNEAHNELDPRGSNDGGASHCFGQIYLPNGARTLEGWTGAELRADARKCAIVVARLVKSSASDRRAPENCPLCIYARGFRWMGNPEVMLEARRLSDVRTSLAKRLFRDVPLSALAQ